MKSKVAIVKVDPKADEHEIRNAVDRLLVLLGGAGIVAPLGGRVLVKPNFGGTAPKVYVRPQVAVALLKSLSGAGYNVIFGEDPALDEAKVYKKWQIDEIARIGGATSVSLRKGPHVKVRVPDPLFFDELEISQYALDADAVVSLARLKTVNVCHVSLSLKNLKGTMVPVQKRRFHCEGLSRGIVDLNKAIRPRLAVIDGLTGYDQNRHKDIPVGLLIGSVDCVAADATAARIIGIDPAGVEHIALAEKAGLGNASESMIEIVGEPLSELIGRFRFSKPVDPFKAIEGTGIEIVQGNPCSTCLNELGRELSAFKGDLNSLGRLRILVGPDAQLPDSTDRVILYGNCLRKHSEKGAFVHGCPPGLGFAGTGVLKKALDAPGLKQA